MPRYNKATLMPCQWVMFFLLAFLSFQGWFVVLRSFQGCVVVFVAAVAAASSSAMVQFFMLYYLVASLAAKAARGDGVQREHANVSLLPKIHAYWQHFHALVCMKHEMPG